MPKKYKETICLKDIVDYYNGNYDYSNRSVIKQPENWLKYLKAAVLKLFNRLPFVIPYTELVLTSRCNLRCVNCANLMQYYNKHDEYSAQYLIESLDKFLEAIDGITWLRLIGGETFLYKNIDVILEYVLNHKKISSVQIVTNGILIPKDTTLSILKHPKASVFISDYGITSKNIENVKEKFSQNGIRFVSKSNLTWEDMGGVDCRNYSTRQLEDSYKNCQYTCKTIFEGKFFACPRSAHGQKLGLIPAKENDYVNLFETTIAQRKKEIMNLYNIDYLQACNYCTSKEDRNTVSAALQMEKVLK